MSRSTNTSGAEPDASADRQAETDLHDTDVFIGTFMRLSLHRFMTKLDPLGVRMESEACRFDVVLEIV